MEEIYVEYSKCVFKYLFSLTNNYEVAEELLQETFYSAIKNNVDMSEFQVLIKYFHNFIGRTAALHALQMVEK